MSKESNSQADMQTDMQTAAGCAEVPATEMPLEACPHDIETVREIELVLEKAQLELLRRKELAVIEMKKIVAEYCKYASEDQLTWN